MSSASLVESMRTAAPGGIARTASAARECSGLTVAGWYAGSMAALDLDVLARHLGLGSLLQSLDADHGGYELLEHWTQGEFHHDVVLRLADGRILVVATNCNGGVKELLLFDELPVRWALWRWRCPDNPEFEGELPTILASTTTTHHFDPCVLLTDDARSEIRPEHRRRVRGGGWELDPSG